MSKGMSIQGIVRTILSNLYVTQGSQLPQSDSTNSSSSCSPYVWVYALGLFRPSLNTKECQHRWLNNLCMYCGEPGHYVRSYPAKMRKCLSITSIHVPALPNQSFHLALPILLQLPGRSIQVSAIIDSGACSCFMNLSFAAGHLILLQTKTRGLSVHLADRSTIKSGPVTRNCSLVGYHCLPPPIITLPGYHFFTFYFPSS